jgi:peptidoglycan/xylan/chitin deacetylase (PgdA/CDA1 family)
MTTPAAGSQPIRLRIPAPYRCAVAFTYDTDMAGGYAPPGEGCHGRTAPFVADYMRRLMDAAERFDARLHFFKIANGLEEGRDYSVYQDALRRGHDVDCHTYNHLNLAYTPPEELDGDLRRANALLREKLGVEPTILRGPGGYPAGALGEDSRRVILANGFRYVSGEYNGGEYQATLEDSACDAGRHPPHRFPDGLVELPFHGFTDRTFFDQAACADEGAYQRWREQWGHRAVPPGWRCPWTAPDALARWIGLLKKCVDHAYEKRLLYVFCSHPYSHYLHDPENTVLPELLRHVRVKGEPVWVGTLRDVIRKLVVEDCA